MTFFVAPCLVTLPGGSWFSEMLAARREMDGLHVDDHESPRGLELYYLLDQMDGVTLHDMNGVAIGELEGLTFLHFNEETRTLVLAVIVTSGSATSGKPDDHTTDLDRLFAGQYDPERLGLTDEDYPYVVIQLDEHGQPTGKTVVIQPYDEDAPEGVCAATMVSSEEFPAEFLERLIHVAA